MPEDVSRFHQALDSAGEPPNGAPAETRRPPSVVGAADIAKVRADAVPSGDPVPPSHPSAGRESSAGAGVEPVATGTAASDLPIVTPS